MNSRTIQREERRASLGTMLAAWSRAEQCSALRIVGVCGAMCRSRGAGFQPGGLGRNRAAPSRGRRAGQRNLEHGAGMPRELAGKDACSTREQQEPARVPETEMRLFSDPS